MKNKIYTSFFTGMVLLFAATSGHAKPVKMKLSRSIIHTQIMSHRLKPGETLAEIFARLHPQNPEYHELVSANNNGTRIATISSGTPLQSIQPDRNGSYRSYRFNRYSSYNNRNDVRSISATGNNRFFLRPSVADKITIDRITNQPSKRMMGGPTLSAQGVIRSTLAAAARTANLPSDIMEQLTQIFAWDLDFDTDISNGDRFTVVYERGGYASGNEIVSAEFINQGQTHRAVRYVDQSGAVGYYTPEGLAMQKAFLSTPVDYARISSHFDLNRRHPILNRIRAHKGVDYAARIGTPIKATGNGEVSFLGHKGGYGQVVILSHGDHYETLYAHLSDFKSGLQNGSHVRQGEIIGYVGQSGLATGPHLHYEFRVDGEHRNPLTITAQLSRSIPVSSASMSDFKLQTQRSLAQLNQAKAKTLFARNFSRYN